MQELNLSDPNLQKVIREQPPRRFLPKQPGSVLPANQDTQMEAMSPFMDALTNGGLSHFLINQAAPPDSMTTQNSNKTPSVILKNLTSPTPSQEDEDAIRLADSIPMPVPEDTPIQKGKIITSDKIGSYSADASKNTNYGAYLGALGGGALAMLGNKTDTIIRDDGDVARAMNAADRERIAMLNPKADMQTAQTGLENAKAGVVANAANHAASSTAHAGLGGDVNSALLSGVRSAAATAAAAAPYDQAISGLSKDKQSAEMQQAQLLQQGAQQRFNIDDARTYVDRNNSLSNIMSAMQGGMSTINMLDRFSKDSKANVTLDRAAGTTEEKEIPIESKDFIEPKKRVINQPKQIGGKSH